MDRRGIRPEDPLSSRLPFVGVENIETDTGILDFATDTRIGEQRSTAYRFDERHVLYAKLRPYLNKVTTPGFVGKCSTELVPLLPREGVDRYFLAYLLRHTETVNFAVASVTGSRMPRTDMNSLMSMRVPLPPLADQRRIVDLLNRMARIERLCAQATDHLSSFISALFIKTFGDPIENPMGWDTVLFGDLILKGPQNGLYRPRSEYGSGTKILRIDGFYDGQLTNPSTWQRVRLDNSSVKKYALAKDDIVINRVNSQRFLGKSAIVPEISEITVFESNMMRLTVDSNRILPKLLIILLQIESARQRLRVNAKDAINQSSINQSDVCRVPIIVPPLTLQHRFTKITTAVQDVVPALEAASRTASALNTSLTSRLLSTHSCPTDADKPKMLIPKHNTLLR